MLQLSAQKETVLKNIRESFTIGLADPNVLEPHNIQIEYRPYSHRTIVQFFLCDFDYHIENLTDKDVKEALLYLCPLDQRIRWTEQVLEQAQIEQKAKKQQILAHQIGLPREPKDLESYFLGLEAALAIVEEFNHGSGDEWDIAVRAIEQKMIAVIKETEEKLKR